MIEGQKLKLGETEYVCPPLNLKAMRRLLPAIGKLKTTGLPTDEDLQTVAEVVHAALVRNYPELDKETVEEQLDLGNMRPALSIVLGQSGLQQGNVPAATRTEEPASLTGQSSSGTSSPPPDGPTTT